MLAESLALSAALFVIGVVGVLTRRNAIIIFMCVELMLNAVGTIAAPLFKDYLLAFELTSVLLLVAIAGAVVLGRGRSVSAR